MRSAPLLAALTVAAVAGCAAATLGKGVDPREQLNEGVAALEQQDWTRARAALEPLYYQRWMEPVGQEALLTLIAVELDGRNPDRSLRAATDLAARLLRIPDVQPWMVPVAESYYLLAVELGAEQEPVEVADSARLEAEARALRAELNAAGRELPTSEREPVPARIARIEAERDEVRAQIDRLTQQVATRDRELRDTKAELERIKKTIRP